MNKLTLPIEVGKSYVRRDGKIVEAKPAPDGFTPECVLVAIADEKIRNALHMVWKDTGLVHRRVKTQEELPHDLIADHIPTKAHRHAAEMLAYAQDAAECAEPWTRWEARPNRNTTWTPMPGHPGWIDGCEYRRRPKTIKLGAREVNAPMRVAPSFRARYYLVDLVGYCVRDWPWDGDEQDYTSLNAGACFATREDAQAALDAILEMLKP